MKTNQALIADVAEYKPNAGECALWWLGQLGFIVKPGKAALVIDAFLSSHPRRQIPPLLKPEEVTNVSVFLGTHDHTDHIDRKSWPALAKASPGARFIVPDMLLPSLADQLGINLNRFIGLDDRVTAEVDGIRVTGIAAAHEFLDRDPQSGRYPHLGFIIEDNGVCLYHSGDCCIYEGLVTKLRQWNFDLMILPINGRDAKRLSRRCIGNMTYQEAADLAGALSPGMVIPAHYDMFADNGENPILFRDYMQVKYPQIPVTLCEHGRRISIRH